MADTVQEFIHEREYISCCVHTSVQSHVYVYVCMYYVCMYIKTITNKFKLYEKFTNQRSLSGIETSVFFFVLFLLGPYICKFSKNHFKGVENKYKKCTDRLS